MISSDHIHRFESQTGSSTSGRRLLPVRIGIFFLSMSALVYEVTLTRLFSVALTYHYVFLVVSMALFGLAFGGVLDDRLSARRLVRGKAEPSLSRWSMLAALAMSASTALIIPITAANSAALLFVVAVVPFFLCGVALAAAFRRFAADSSYLYAFDLAGAAVGAVIVVWALNAVGGVSTALLSSVVAAGAGVILLFERPIRGRSVLLPGGVAVATLLVLFLNGRESILGDIPIGNSPEKELFTLLQNPSFEAEIVETRWSAFGRTDLVGGTRGPDVMGLYIDGAAGTSMYRWDGSREPATDELKRLKYGFAGSVPLAFLKDDQKDNALIIGPGGGRDVLINLLWGVDRITAVEVNPDFVALVRKYEDFNGGIYTRIPEVDVVVDEGRNFLKRSEELYDIIMLTLPITKSSRSFQGYALTENFLFTRESFQDYLGHLTPEGSLVIVGHSVAESLRLLTTGLAALQDMGVSVTEAMKQIYVLGEHRMPVVVFQKTPLEKARAEELHTLLHLVGFDGRISYIPYAEQKIVRLIDTEADSVEAEWQMMNQTLIDLASGDLSVDELIGSIPVDLRPASDDRPFFFKYQRGLPTVLATLFWLSAVFSFGVLYVPSVRRRRRWLYRRAFVGGRLSHPLSLRSAVPFVFLGIGVGFMLVEVALFQKLLLVLGHPTIALAVLLSSLLIGSGLGSLVSNRVPATKLGKAIAISAAAMSVVLFLEITFLGPLSVALLHLGGVRFVAAAVAVMLTGFPMGFPFPLAIRLLQERGQESEIPWMWAINGAASVFGAVLAVSLAVLWGYSSALWLGMLGYGAVGVLGTRLRHLPAKAELQVEPIAAPTFPPL